ncbi:Putative rmlC-like cupin domain superfamily, rmlC-like jelly roll protein [Septoria linicola]|uniref:RmlC-like cupin domain superfamily, rmlC-like jelly roll protein n=1 Tax=Septoria linicola TaxID=215465 RepID=A0A9Q9EH58_9PEZI|nr:putative rmlC-like cupin domain superfamily, rmlC-like jelly roll protein [Septoria linicola]USW49649.1 Putative rmlC-like cupin domain superfamily, rmlC-like jelly roll protein [Septoria linicola]
MAGLVSVPDVGIEFIEAKAGETFKLGPITCRVLEDGSHTDNRIGVAELTMPPKTPGPPPHWHEMHDETFYITKGSVRFHVPDTTEEGKDKKIIDAKTGDYVVVPIRAPHTFSNPNDEEAKIFFTSTPSFYINYFKLLGQLAKPDQPVPAEVNMQAMAMFATILADKKPRRPE